MYFDALTTAAICDELNEKVLGARVQKIVAPSEDSLAFELYANHQTNWLLVSHHPQHARIHLSEQKLQRLVGTDTPLLLLLKKYVRDGRLRSIEQLPLERVLILTFTKLVADGDTRATECRLIIEIMGRLSNIILVDDDGRVMDAAKRITPQMNRYRTTLPHQPYVVPPPQAKLDPEQCTTATLADAIRTLDRRKPAWQVLVDGFRGISPLAAREIVFRATGKTDASVQELTDNPSMIQAIAEQLRSLFHLTDTHRWDPTLAFEDGAILAFAPYRLTHLVGVNGVASISQAIAQFYSQVETARPHQLARVNLQRLISQEREKLVRRKEALERGLGQESEADRLRYSGQMILAYSQQIAPGQTVLEVDGRPIELDPRLTPSENAQTYFRRYDKIKAAQREVPALLAQTEISIAFLDQTSVLLDLAEDQETIANLRAELTEAGYGGSKVEPKPVKKAGKHGKMPPQKHQAHPLRYRIDGHEVLVGRSGKENEAVTFDLASANDIWLHARGLPGSHVIIRVNGPDPTDATIRRVAALAAYFSQARHSSKVPVDYTRRRYVRKVKGAPAGFVTFSNESTLTVSPAAPPTG